MNESITTKDGLVWSKAGPGVLLLSAVFDLLSVSLPIALVFAPFGALNISVAEPLGGVIGISVLLYVLLAHRGQLPSIGGRALGLARLRCKDVMGYDGRGVVYGVSTSRKPRRVLVLLAYIAAAYVVLFIAI